MKWFNKVKAKQKDSIKTDNNEIIMNEPQSSIRLSKSNPKIRANPELPLKTEASTRVQRFKEVRDEIDNIDETNPYANKLVLKGKTHTGYYKAGYTIHGTYFIAFVYSNQEPYIYGNQLYVSGISYELYSGSRPELRKMYIGSDENYCYQNIYAIRDTYRNATKKEEEYFNVLHDYRLSTTDSTSGPVTGMYEVWENKLNLSRALRQYYSDVQRKFRSYVTPIE